MRLSDLQNKDIVNMNDGKRLGNIIDIKLDEESGNVIGIILENKGFMTRLISNNPESEITWNNIVKIGEDVILVKTN